MLTPQDFSQFIKKRAGLEEEHAAGLRKLCRFASDGIARPDARKGTYARQFEETTRIHSQLAENGMRFSEELHKMFEDLNDMIGNMERGRKYWKTSGMNHEKRVHDSELLMEKAKAKYDSIADEYERVRSPDKRIKPSFSLRTGKHGAALEEELQRRVQAADSEYQNKVNAANLQRGELLHTLRPTAVKALKDMIFECDAGLTYQLQKFGTLPLLPVSTPTLTPPSNPQRTPPPQQRPLRLPPKNRALPRRAAIHARSRRANQQRIRFPVLHSRARLQSSHQTAHRADSL